MVLPPDRVGRAEILKVHTRDAPLAPDVDQAEVAAQTAGLVGADLREEDAVGLLARERSRLDALVAGLLREESLDEAQIRAITGLPVETAAVR